MAMYWVKTNERHPEHCNPVLASGFNGGLEKNGRWYDMAIYAREGLWYCEADGSELYTPTHWAEIERPE